MKKAIYTTAVILTIIATILTTIFAIYVFNDIIIKSPKYEYKINLTKNEKQTAVKKLFNNNHNSSFYDSIIIEDVIVGDVDSYGRFCGVVLYKDASGEYTASTYKINGIDNEGVIYYTLNYESTIGGSRQAVLAYDESYVDGETQFGSVWNTELVKDKDLMSTEHPEGYSIVQRYINWFMGIIQWVMSPFIDLDVSIVSILVSFFVSLFRAALIFLPCTLIQIWTMELRLSSNPVIKLIGVVSGIVFSIAGAFLTVGLYFISSISKSAVITKTGIGNGQKQIFATWDRNSGQFIPQTVKSTNVVSGDTLYTFDGPSVKQPWQASNITKLTK